MFEAKPERKGLSPSSFTEYQACGRRYKFRKILKVLPDADYIEDQSVFNVGKAFHKACEDTLHDISKLSDDHLKGIIELYQLEVSEYFPMLKAMLQVYGRTHKASGLSVVACEVEVETPFFFGIVDVVLKDDKTGEWWIGDLKTAATYTPSQDATLLSHPQLNLYLAHAKFLASKLELDISKLKGCRYRVTTKTKIKRKLNEEDGAYVARLMMSVKSLDFVLPVDRMIHKAVFAAYKESYLEISKGESGRYPQNFGNCFAYYKSCPYWSKCHGRTYSETGPITVVGDGDFQR